jgi:hypothetical protein
VDEAELAALQALGLPAGFGSSKVMAAAKTSMLVVFGWS